MKKLPLYPELPFPPVQKVPGRDRNPNCELCPLAKTNPAGQRCLAAEGTTGGLLIVGEHPTEVERRLDRQFTTPGGRWLRDVLDQLAPQMPRVYTTGLGCLPSFKSSEDDLVAATEACRPYLAQLLEETKPKMVLLFGPQAGESFLGRSFDALSVRRGYGWCFVPDVRGVNRPVPVFLLPRLSEINSNRLIKSAVEADLFAIINERVSLRTEPLYGNYEIIETVEDAKEAHAALEAAMYVATDVEASGEMFEPDFRIECIANSMGSRTFVWPRATIEDPRTSFWLARILREYNHTSWNGQYDFCAIECEPCIKIPRLDSVDGLSSTPCPYPPHKDGLCTRPNFGKFNLQSDARLKRKLRDADATAKLEVSAELVGMGGHKEENHAAVDIICTQLRKLALSRELTPSGKKRKAPEVSGIDVKQIPESWYAALNNGVNPRKFAHRFVPRWIEHRYVALDACSTYYLEGWANEQLCMWSDDGLLTIWEEVSKPAMWAWARATMNGFPTDRESVELLADYLKTEADQVLKQIHAYRPGLNPASTKQMGEYMAELGLKSPRMTDGGKPSWAKEILEGLKDKHPVIPLLLRHRLLTDVNGDQVQGLLPDIRSDGKVHPSYLLDGAATGRPSSKEPNFFNRLKGRDEQSRELGTLLRSCHQAPPGWTIIEADEGQIEIRKAADLSRDPAMLAMLTSGVDFHTQSAQKFAPVMGLDFEKMSKAEQDLFREKSKCFHPDTEVLTRQGWRRIADLARTPEWRTTEVMQATPGNDGRVKLEWVLPDEVYTKRHPSKKLIWLKNESIDLRVTPDHRMLQWTDSGYSQVVTPVKFGLHGYWKCAGNLDSYEATESLDLLRLAVAVQADGSYNVSGAGIRFGFSKKRKRDRLCALLDAAALPYTENFYESTKVWSIYVKAAGAKALRCLLDPDKTMPWSWLLLGPEERRAICDEAAHWDGSIIAGGRSYHFSTSIEKNADVLQAIAASVDRKTRKIRTATGWLLSVKDRGYAKGRNVTKTELAYTDEVSCLSVPSSYVLVRDRGVPVITGQTSNFAAIYEIPAELGFMLSKRLNVERIVGEELGQALFKTYTGLRSFMDAEYAEAWRTGRSRTFWKGKQGRSRPLWQMGKNPPTLPELEAALKAEKRGGYKAESKYDKTEARATYNGAVQGSSVDIITSMLWPVCCFLDENTNGGLFLLQIYDSIMLMVRDEDVDKTLKFLVALMRDELPERRGYMDGVPLTVDVKKGKSWGSLEKIKV